MKELPSSVGDKRQWHSLSVIFLHQNWFGFVVTASSLSQRPSCHWYVVVSLVLARYSLFPDPSKETAYSSHFALIISKTVKSVRGLVWVLSEFVLK
jgi:hypothetical protein